MHLLIRLSDSDYGLIKRAAAVKGMSVSLLTREAVMEANQQVLAKPRLVYEKEKW